MRHRSGHGSAGGRRALPLLLLLALAAAYAGGLSGPFVFDDHGAIERNRSIRALWPLPGPLSPPGSGHPTRGRPIANWSLAASRALLGPEPRGFRLGNLALHAGSALLLFGVLRRSLASTGLPAPLQRAAPALAFATALLWCVHPLASEVVYYATQRTEALVGFWLLLSFYAGIRAVESQAAPRRARAGPGPYRVWCGLAAAACALGMASKEVMAAAPPLFLLWDRAFAAGSLRTAWALRRALHAGLWGGLAVLAALLLQKPRGRAASLWDLDYLLAQGEVVRHYLGLALWPRDLVFDYGPLVRSAVAPGAADALLLLGAVGVAALAWRSPRLGFPGAFSLLLLAPTSSLVAMPPEVGAERRMYLPLVGILAWLVCGAYAAGGAALSRAGLAAPGRRAVALLLLLALAGGAIARTRLRARDYSSELAVWRSTVQVRPGNPRAHYILGNELRRAGQRDAARAAFRRALAIVETSPAHTNLGALLAQQGALDEARRHLERALELDPRSAEARANLGLVLLAAGDPAPAVPHLERALARDPEQDDLRLALARARALLDAPPPSGDEQTRERVR